MTLELRRGLTQHGHVLFLDAQKWDMNRSGWPHIGPCIADNEHKVCVAGDALCVAESIVETHRWVTSEAVVETKNLLTVKKIRSGQMINQISLLQLGTDQLGFENVCKLVV